MKKTYLLIFILVFINVLNSLASPLIFKSQKEITTVGVFELGVFDTTKYKQIRIGINRIKNSPTKEQVEMAKSKAEIEVNAARRELIRAVELLEKGVISKLEYDQAKDRLEKAEVYFRIPVEVISLNISLYAVENGEEIFLIDLDKKSNSQSFVLDTPPSKIVVKVSGQGKYSLFVWGTL
mgnify:CR=1 FL=1